MTYDHGSICTHYVSTALILRRPCVLLLVSHTHSLASSLSLAFLLYYCSTLLIVDVESDNTIDSSDGCPYFSANTSLTYSYVCECAPTPAPTTPSPTPKPSNHPTPKPSYAPSVAPFPAPTPKPTFEPTEACRENKTVFVHQEQLNKNGDFGVDIHAIFNNDERVCTLEKATLYTAFDTVVTDPAQIDDVSVAIAPQDLTFAKAVWDDRSPDNVCTGDMLTNGKACYASCGAYTDTSPDQHDQPGWPAEFSNWEVYTGVNYQSCNDFYGIDVTQYLMYTDGNLTACADESIAGDYTKCPALGSYFYSEDYEGGEQGDPEFKVMQDLYMDIVCNCIPDGDKVKMVETIKPAVIEYEKKHKGLLNGKKPVPVKQNVKMRLRGH